MISNTGGNSHTGHYLEDAFLLSPSVSHETRLDTNQGRTAMGVELTWSMLIPAQSFESPTRRCHGHLHLAKNRIDYRMTAGTSVPTPHYGEVSMNLNRRGFLIFSGAAITAVTLPFSTRAADKLKIGMIGSGRVGSGLGNALVLAGHEVMFSSRHLEDDQLLAISLGAGASAGTPREAAAFGEVLFFAVPYGALPDVGKDLADLIKGKVVIDTCNPFPKRDGEIADWAREKGAGLASAELLPGARLVRAFNAIGAARMGSAYQEPGVVGMPIAGDDAEAVAVASALIRDIGYEPVLIGGLERGKHLIPGTPLAGEHSAEEIRQIAAGLE